MLAHRADHALVDLGLIHIHRHGRDDISRTDRVAADGFARQQKRRVLCYADDRSLGRDVSRAASSVDARDGCDVDDGGARLQFGHRRADALHGADLIDGDDLADLFVVKMVDGRKPRIQNAGVVDEHVHLPERLNCLLHQPAAVRVDGDIRGYRKHGTALRFDLLRDGIQCVLSARADDDVRPLSRKQQGRRFSDARIAARNDRCLSFQ